MSSTPPTSPSGGRPSPLATGSVLAKALASTSNAKSYSPKGSRTTATSFADFVERTFRNGTGNGSVNETDNGGGERRDRSQSASQMENEISRAVAQRHSWTEEVERNARKGRPASLPRDFPSNMKNFASNIPASSSSGSRSPSTPNRSLGLSQSGGNQSPSTTTPRQGELIINESRILGKGYFGVVYEGTLNKRRVAVKVLKRPNIQHLEKELSMLRDLRSTNCVLFLEYFPRRAAIVMEFMAGGSLHDLLHTVQQNNNVDKVPLSKRLRAKIALDVVEGLLYLHSLPLLHRDLTSGNILLVQRLDISTLNFVCSTIDEDSPPLAKISDFGLARKGDTYQSMNTGNILYVAPEVYDGLAAHSPASDMYSFGILLYEIFSRESPYVGMAPREAANRAAGRDDLRPVHCRTAFTELVPDHIQDLCTSCWDASFQKRPKASHVADSLKEILTLHSSCLFVCSIKRQVPDELLTMLRQKAGLAIKLSSGSVGEASKAMETSSTVVCLIGPETLKDDVVCYVLCEAIVLLRPIIVVVETRTEDPDNKIQGTATIQQALSLAARIAFPSAKQHVSEFVSKFCDYLSGMSKERSMCPMIAWPSFPGTEAGLSHYGHTQISMELVANEISKPLSEFIMVPNPYPSELVEAASACAKVYSAARCL